MARFDTTGINDVINAMISLGEDTGEIADKMLMESAEIVKQDWKQAAEEAGHRDTGAMISAIGYPKQPKTINDVKSIDIYPQGVDSKGIRNAEKAFVLNYGTSRFIGSHFVEIADKRSGAKVEKKMREIWEKYHKEKGLTD